MTKKKGLKFFDKFVALTLALLIGFSVFATLTFVRSTDVSAATFNPSSPDPISEHDINNVVSLKNSSVENGNTVVLTFGVVPMMLDTFYSRMGFNLDEPINTNIWLLYEGGEQLLLQDNVWGFRTAVYGQDMTVSGYTYSQVSDGIYGYDGANSVATHYIKVYVPLASLDAQFQVRMNFFYGIAPYDAYALTDKMSYNSVKSNMTITEDNVNDIMKVTKITADSSYRLAFDVELDVARYEAFYHQLFGSDFSGVFNTNLMSSTTSGLNMGWYTYDVSSSGSQVPTGMTKVTSGLSAWTSSGDGKLKTTVYAEFKNSDGVAFLDSKVKLDLSFYSGAAYTIKVLTQNVCYLDFAKTVIDELVAENTERAALIGNLQLEIKNLTTELNEAKSILASIPELESKIAYYEDEIDLLNGQVSELNELINSLREDAVLNNTEIERLEVELSATKNERDILQARVDSLTSELASADELVATIPELETQLKVNQKAVADLTNEKNQLLAQIRELELKLAEAQSGCGASLTSAIIPSAILVLVAGLFVGGKRYAKGKEKA